MRRSWTNRLMGMLVAGTLTTSCATAGNNSPLSANSLEQETVQVPRPCLIARPLSKEEWEGQKYKGAIVREMNGPESLAYIYLIEAYGSRERDRLVWRKWCRENFPSEANSGPQRTASGLRKAPLPSPIPSPLSRN